MCKNTSDTDGNVAALPSCAKDVQVEVTRRNSQAHGRAQSVRLAESEFSLAAASWSRYDQYVRFYLGEQPGLAGILRSHGTAVSLIAIVWGISQAAAWTDSAPRLQATIVNEATFAREFVVGSAQSPARQRFWLGPGQARSLRYTYVGETNLAIAELRAGCVVWEARAGHWQADRRNVATAVQKFGIADNGHVQVLANSKL